MDYVSFARMIDGTKEDCGLLTKHEIEFAKSDADGLFKALRHLLESVPRYPATRREHHQQSAERDFNADVDWFTASFLSDIEDVYTPKIHDARAVKNRGSVVRKQRKWRELGRAEIQMLNFDRHFDPFDRNKRNRLGNIAFCDEYTVFGECWDQARFDTSLPAFPTELFISKGHVDFVRSSHTPAGVRHGEKEPIRHLGISSGRTKMNLECP